MFASEICRVFNRALSVFSGTSWGKCTYVEEKSRFSSILNYQQKQSSGWSNQRSRSPQGRFQEKIVFWKEKISLMFSDFESKDFSRVSKIVTFVSRGTYRGKTFLVGIFILFSLFSGFRRNFLGTFRKAFGRVVKLAFYNFSETRSGKSSFFEKDFALS